MEFLLFSGCECECVRVYAREYLYFCLFIRDILLMIRTALKPLPFAVAHTHRHTRSVSVSCVYNLVSSNIIILYAMRYRCHPSLDWCAVNCEPMTGLNEDGKKCRGICMYVEKQKQRLTRVRATE